MEQTVVLHKSLYARINTIKWASQKTKDKALHFVHTFLRKRFMENTDSMEYTDMAQVYLKKKLGGNYRNVTKPLLEANILQSNGFYKKGYFDKNNIYVKGQCLSYRLNPELFKDELIVVPYKLKKGSKRKKQKCKDQVTINSKNILRQIRLNGMSVKNIIKFVEISLTDERIRSSINVISPDRSICEIKEEIVQVRTIDKNNPRSKAHKKYVQTQKVSLHNKYLIQDGAYCYIDNLDDYITRKRQNLVQAYTDQLIRLKNRNVYADRNETNKRLDSNVTNLKNDFLSLLQIDGQNLSQIDLKNSQFRFFIYLLENIEKKYIKNKIKKPKKTSEERTGKKVSKGEEKEKKKENIRKKPVTLLYLAFVKNCIKKKGLNTSFTEDYKYFKKLVKTGKLYEYLQSIYERETGDEIDRKAAKKIMFTASFASHKYNTKGKEVLKKYFPSIVDVIDDFKKSMIVEYAQGGEVTKEVRDKGNASFAILLQNVESEVFIDKILEECFNKKLKVLSKHDSIICRESDKKYVTSIICKIMNKIFGNNTYSLDIDGDVFVPKEKKDSRFIRVAKDILSGLLNNNKANKANAPPIDSISSPKMVHESPLSKVHKRKEEKISQFLHEETVNGNTEGDSNIRSPRIRALKKLLTGK